RPCVAATSIKYREASFEGADGVVTSLCLFRWLLTSTRKWILRLGGHLWQLLHRLVYVSAAAGILHYFWRVKLDARRPIIYGIVLMVLLILRMFHKTHASFDSRDPIRLSQ